MPDDPAFAGFYNVFEAVSTVVFTAEYLLRLWACVETVGGVVSAWPVWLVGECAAPEKVNADGSDTSCGAAWRTRLRWATNPTAVFDVVVVLAFWVDLVLEYWATEQMKGIGSTLRMFRIFQFAITILRLETQSPAFGRVAKVLTSSASELLLCLFLAGVLMVLGAVLIFFIEYQQVHFLTFLSLSHSHFLSHCSHISHSFSRRRCLALAITISSASAARRMG